MISKVSTFLGPNGLYRSGATPSLVLSLDSTNSMSYNGPSQTWFDLSIRGNNGTLNDVNQALIGSSSNILTSLLFNGTGSYISFTQSDGIPLGNSNYTIETWFNSNSYEFLEQGPFVGWGTIGEDNKTNVFRLNGNGLYTYWWNNDLNIAFTGTSSMIVGNWYYAVTTFDGTNRNIYLNGELKATDTPGTHSVTDNSTLQIGSFYNSYFDGKISKVRVSDKALSGVKILSNFNTDKVKYGYQFGSMTFNDTQSPYSISTSNDYVFGTNDFTIEAFFKLSISSTYNYSGVISQRRLGQSQPSINIQQSNTSTPLIEFCSGNGWLAFSASNDTWYHTAISRTGGTTSYYVNGDLFSEVSDTTNYNDDTLVVGRYYRELSDYYFNGIISNVRVINGTSLYSGSTITKPTPKLTATTDTKFLINSQKTTPTVDLSGSLQSVTASNIGWTASLPNFYEFNYDDFSSTTGLVLLGTDGITNNHIYLTNTANSENGNVFRSDAIRFDRSFSFEWVFECSGGNGADGFCVQWTSVNDVNGGVGGDVSMLPLVSTINALKFLTWTNNSVVWFHSNSLQSSQSLSGFSIRQNVYYWTDYNHNTSTMNIYYSTTSTKPGSPQHTFTSFTFDSGTYYIGFGAATGGSNDNHILKSMKLTF